MSANPKASDCMYALWLLTFSIKQLCPLLPHVPSRTALGHSKKLCAWTWCCFSSILQHKFLQLCLLVLTPTILLTFLLACPDHCLDLNMIEFCLTWPFVWPTTAVSCSSCTTYQTSAITLGDCSGSSDLGVSCSGVHAPLRGFMVWTRCCLDNAPQCSHTPMSCATQGIHHSSLDRPCDNYFIGTCCALIKVTNNC